MIHTRMIGDVKVTNVVEYYGPTHLPDFIYPDFDARVLSENADWMAPRFWVPAMNRLIVAIQLWVVQAGDRVVVIDTGVGNRKARAAERMNALNTLTLAWLEAAGAARHKVTHVVMTHLHSDHIGWNTVLDNGAWVPTFPNARYFAPRRDFDHFRAAFEAGSGLPDPGAFGDSIVPILEAGLLEFLDDQPVVADLLAVEPAPGHTPGMVTLALESRGERGAFSADIFHNPLQIVRPSWNTAFCMLPDAARQTRAAFLDKVADKGVLVMPCHFPLPGCGYVSRTAGGFTFRPADG